MVLNFHPSLYLSLPLPELLHTHLSYLPDWRHHPSSPPPLLLDRNNINGGSKIPSPFLYASIQRAVHRGVKWEGNTKVGRSTVVQNKNFK